MNRQRDSDFSGIPNAMGQSEIMKEAVSLIHTAIDELMGVLEKAVLFCDSETLTAELLCFSRAKKIREIQEFVGRHGNLPEAVKDLEKRMIFQALVKTRWNQRKASQQ